MTSEKVRIFFVVVLLSKLNARRVYSIKVPVSFSFFFFWIAVAAAAWVFFSIFSVYHTHNRSC